jgi:iron-sulfur cluster assembly accessory protein
MITLTPSAIAKVKEISESEAIGHYNIRLKVIGGGCAGMSNDIYFEDLEPTNLDEVFEHDGVKLIVDALSISYLDGAEVDFVEMEFSSGFKVNNPQVKSTCGCGSSFSV